MGPGVVEHGVSGGRGRTDQQHRRQGKAQTAQLVGTGGRGRQHRWQRSRGSRLEARQPVAQGSVKLGVQVVVGHQEVSFKSSRSCALERDSQLPTVPAGTPRSWPISAWV